MNREIKFRAYHNKAQKMLESGTNRQIFSWQDEGQDITIMQYTGLKDRNGKEIYEGDVVTFWGGKGKIIYFDVYASFMIEYEQGNLFGLEGVNNVIGNIYENPELLNNVLNDKTSVATDVK